MSNGLKLRPAGAEPQVRIYGVTYGWIFWCGGEMICLMFRGSAFVISPDGEQAIEGGAQ